MIVLCLPYEFPNKEKRHIKAKVFEIQALLPLYGASR